MAGLYIHIPFCSALCPYCDFAVVVGRPELHERYLEALLAELEQADWAEPFDSVFIGGGTPSFVGHDLLTGLLDRVRPRLAPNAEVTIEANPESFVAPTCVTRVSIGAQSFIPHVLRALGRTHDVVDTQRAVAAARDAGVDNVNLDLIFGAPGESDDDWARSLDAALALEPAHLSCYALTIEERTPFGGAVARGDMAAPDPDVLADRYEYAARALADAGFERYEVSNWARPGAACTHNLTYWTQGDYLGVGIGAHSHRDGHRWWNTRSIARYLDDPAHALDGEEHLGPAARAEEWLSLRVRLADGFDVAEASERLGRSVAGAVADLAAAGLVEEHAGRVRLTTRGMLLDNEVTLRLLGAPAGA